MRRSFLISIILLAAALPAYASVVINEIAWMGTKESASNEWIELYSTNKDEKLDGWILETEDGGMKINLKGTTTDSYYLIERTDDKTVPDVKADLVASFGKGLSNDGEILILKDANENIVDKVDGSGGWALGGDNDIKKTLQRNSLAPSSWITAIATPRAKNAEYVQPPKITPPASKGSGPQAKLEEAKPRAEKEKLDKLAIDISSSEPDTKYSLQNTELLWLFGGILAGAVLGLLYVIITKWKRSP